MLFIQCGVLFTQGILQSEQSSARLHNIKAEKDRSEVPLLPVGFPNGKTILNYGGMKMKKRIAGMLLVTVMMASALTA